jgi:hypothetical protein
VGRQRKGSGEVQVERLDDFNTREGKGEGVRRLLRSGGNAREARLFKWESCPP